MKACDILRSASRHGRIFLVELDSTYQDLSKNDFFEILVIFLDCANILDHFSDKSLILGNQLKPFERYPYFLPILMVFGL